MSKHTDVMDLLATRRPAFFDDPGDLDRRRHDIERAMSAPLPLGSSAVSPRRSGLLTRSRPVAIGIAAAATMAVVTGGTAVIFDHQDRAAPAATSPTLTDPEGTFLLDSTEVHQLSSVRRDGATYALDEVSTVQSWSPRDPDGRRIEATTTKTVLADERTRQAWERAGAPTIKEIDTPARTEVTTSNATVTYDGCGDTDQCLRFPADATGAVQKYRTAATSRAEAYLLTQRSVERDGDPDNNRPVKKATPAELAALTARATFDTVAGYLNAPISGPARLAIYHELGATGGITKLGLVKDQRGREGMGYATSADYRGQQGAETRLIVNPDTGALLATERREPGSTQISESTLYLERRWTDATPPKPVIRHYPDGTSDLTWPAGR